MSRPKQAFEVGDQFAIRNTIHTVTSACIQENAALDVYLVDVYILNNSESYTQYPFNRYNVEHLYIMINTLGSKVEVEYYKPGEDVLFLSDIPKRLANSTDFIVNPSK